jgi:Mn2+/Fe2+ NRAMP family transporter
MRYANLLKTLGPGILFASTAIGVSHLVQSTRAGAGFGFGLLWAVVLANLFKYPFFEYGSRYANAKGESIIDGYSRMGRWMLMLYFLITVVTMFFVVAAVGSVTAGFLQNLFGFGNLQYTTIGLFILCIGVLMTGKYKLLDSLVKVIGAVLLVSTLIAFALTLAKGPATAGSLMGYFDWEGEDVLFLIALMGWMPTAVDLSAWNSLWTVERIKQTGYRPALKETLFDFNFGYIVSAILSVCFITLGAYMFFGTGNELASSSGAFSNQIVEIFSGNIGTWSYPIIAVASFSIMFGTCIAVFDGYARASERTSELLFLSSSSAKSALKNDRFYNVAILLIGVGAYSLIHYFLFATSNVHGFKKLVDVATTLSFLVAPVIAIANYRLVTMKDFPVEARPPRWLRVLSVTGILFLVGFSVFYLLNT